MKSELGHTMQVWHSIRGKVERIQKSENDQKRGKGRGTWGCLSRKGKEGTGRWPLPKKKRLKKKDTGQ